MSSAIEQETGVWLAVRFEPLTALGVSAEGVELVMRDVRRFAQAAALGAPLGRRKRIAPDVPLSPRVPSWTLWLPDAQYEQITLAIPSVTRIEIGSLLALFDVAKVIGMLGMGGFLGSFLYLIERYWNLGLRLQLEAAQLRSEIAKVGSENDDDGPLIKRLDSVDEATGTDERTVLELMRPTDGVLTDDAGEELDG